MTAITPIYIEYPPSGTPVPIVASIPHSGMYVPPEISACFTEQQRGWLRNTDWYLPVIYDFLPDLGVTVIEATHSRYVVDLNRNPAGDLFGGFWHAVIAKETGHGAPVYDVMPAIDTLAQRLPRYHAPYHQRLATLLETLADRFGSALLLDLHSFMGPIDNDICLGDRRGDTCSSLITDVFQKAFADQGFDVVRNDPFSGGYIVHAHAKRPCIQALQIELRYTNYLDCAQIDEPGIPPLDAVRIAAVREKLRPALETSIKAVTENCNNMLNQTDRRR